MVDSDTMVVAAEAADGSMVQPQGSGGGGGSYYLGGLPPAAPYPVLLLWLHGPTTGNSRIEFVSFVPA